MDDVGGIFRMKKSLLHVWVAMKGDAYMHFVLIPWTLLFDKLE